MESIDKHGRRKNRHGVPGFKSNDGILIYRTDFMSPWKFGAIVSFWLVQTRSTTLSDYSEISLRNPPVSNELFTDTTSKLHEPYFPGTCLAGQRAIAQKLVIAETFADNHRPNIDLDAQYVID